MDAGSWRDGEGELESKSWQEQRRTTAGIGGGGGSIDGNRTGRLHLARTFQ